MTISNALRRIKVRLYCALTQWRGRPISPSAMEKQTARALVWWMGNAAVHVFCVLIRAFCKYYTSAGGNCCVVLFTVLRLYNCKPQGFLFFIWMSFRDVGPCRCLGLFKTFHPLAVVDGRLWFAHKWTLSPQPRGDGPSSKLRPQVLSFLFIKLSDHLAADEAAETCPRLSSFRLLLYLKVQVIKLSFFFPSATDDVRVNHLFCL